MCVSAKPAVTTSTDFVAEVKQQKHRRPMASATIATFADYFGLAVLTPALPFYLQDLGISDEDVPMWNGVITTCQFAAIIFGNIFWGRFTDRNGSQRALQLAMAGDTVFFALSAVAPFGLRDEAGAVMLAVVRFGAGLFTPLVSAILFIFDRADSPQAVMRGMGNYAMAIMCAYALGGLAVGTLYEHTGWAPLNVITSAIAGLAFLYVTFLSAPPISLERPKPEGVMRALRTAEFATHALTALCVGYSMNVGIFMFVIIAKEQFRWSAQVVGMVFISIPAIMMPINFIAPRVVARFGLHRPINVGSIVSCLSFSALAVWASHLSADEDEGSGSAGEGSASNVCILLTLFATCFISMIFQQNPNQARGKYIADKYAKNARGVVTSASRNFFAIGQAIAPIISGFAYTINPGAPYTVIAFLLACNTGLFAITGVPLWHDPSPEAAAAEPNAPKMTRKASLTLRPDWITRRRKCDGSAAAPEPGDRKSVV